jgi:glycosyltransferase involved in cell wall biosynthesis
MKIAVIVAGIGPSAGGLYYSVHALSRGVANAGDIVEVFAMGTYTSAVFKHWAPLVPQTFPVVGPQAYRYAPGMREAVESFRPDVIHVHGLWMYSSWVALKVAGKLDCPLVLSPRGMLDSWALQNSAWKKKIMSLLQENRFLRRVDCFHALNQSELGSIRALGHQQPICVLPNGTDLPSVSDLSSREEGKSKKRLIFIGRIHPKKGIPNLLEAWAKLQNANASTLKEWALEIYGWDDGNHLEGYRKLADQLGICESVTWPGSIYGADKAEVLREADAFILPSFSEGLPMSVVEAWGYGLPVLMTQACNLPEGFSTGAAIEMHTTIQGTTQGLQTLMELSEEDRLTMGLRGRELAASKFTWSKQVALLRTAYKWLTGVEPMPESIIYSVEKEQIS